MTSPDHDSPLDSVSLNELEDDDTQPRQGYLQAQEAIESGPGGPSIRHSWGEEGAVTRFAHFSGFTVRRRLMGLENRMGNLRTGVVALAAAIGALMIGASPARAYDSDGDGVDDQFDACPGTITPEEVPTRQLLPLRYALTDADTTFNERSGESSFTTGDTGGCSCEQIIALSGLGDFSTRFGCSGDAMGAFVAAEACTHLPGDGVEGPPLIYLDNGDGTITDLNTRLMWEKKVPGGGGLPTCLTELHALNSKCRFDGDGGNPPRTIWSWIDAVNTEGYAGYDDWRVPNIKELQSIVDYSRRQPAVDPIFEPQGINYWSSTAVPGSAMSALRVDFGVGLVPSIGKVNDHHVRGVRGP